jgi:hypothetical protein
MLERAGLAVLEMYGSLDRQPFKLGSHQLFVVAQKQKLSSKEEGGNRSRA